MPAEVIKSRLIPAQGREEILIMDDFGTPFLLYVSVTDSANRQHHIDTAIAKQSANQDALVAYATSQGQDISAQLRAGESLKSQAKKDGTQ